MVFGSRLTTSRGLFLYNLVDGDSVTFNSSSVDSAPARHVSDHDLAAVDETLSAYQIVSALLLFHQSDAGKWLIAFTVLCSQQISHSTGNSINSSRRDELSEEEGVPCVLQIHSMCLSLKYCWPQI